MLPPHRIAVLALPGVIPYELGVPSRIFTAATAPDGSPLYEVRTCSLDGKEVPTAFDFGITVQHDASLMSEVDTVILPTVHPLDTGCQTPESRSALALLRKLPATVRIVSFCTASFLLAETGLLDGLSATTHWALAEEFQRRHPRITVDPDVLYVDNGNVATAAGASSAVDLCLHLIRRDFGSEAANRAARICVVPPWRDGGQAQYIQHPVPTPAATTTSATREWALGRLGKPLSLTELAAHARMSRRSFTRRFREEVGMSPGQWLIARRVDRARELLEASELTVDQVARATGFANAVSLRQHLRATVGVSPLVYRRTFRAVGEDSPVPA